jgi:hypothetical protein
VRLEEALAQWAVAWRDAHDNSKLSPPHVP